MFFNLSLLSLFPAALCNISCNIAHISICWNFFCFWPYHSSNTQHAPLFITIAMTWILTAAICHWKIMIPLIQWSIKGHPVCKMLHGVLFLSTSIRIWNATPPRKEQNNRLGETLHQTWAKHNCGRGIEIIYLKIHGQMLASYFCEALFFEFPDRYECH